MIPKVIHYCWFGGAPLPKTAERCIDSWKKYFPDFEIKRWDEGNFNVNMIPYTQDAYKAKKYAFVSDYARIWILYHYGGLYFDTDVKVIKSFDDILQRGAFMGCENDAKPGATPNQLGVAPGLGLGVNPGLGLGVNPGLGLYEEILSIYHNFQFFDKNGNIVPHTIVSIVTDLLCSKGLKNLNEVQYVEGVYIYPRDYFCPFSQITGKCIITPNSHSIHLYDGSWLNKDAKFALTIRKYLGGKFFEFLCKVKRLLHFVFAN